MKVNVPIAISAADSNARTITGRILRFEEKANASTGKVMFAKGSIAPAPVFLNVGHEAEKRVGKTLDTSLSADGMDIYSVFKIAATTLGNDVLVEAADGYRQGLSVEANVHEYEMMDDGTMRVLSGELTGVGLVLEPAVKSAKVLEVAASESEEEAPVAEEVSEETQEETTPTTEGDEVDNTVTPAEAVETVEAAKSVTASASSGWTVGNTRTPITNAATYLEHKVKAKRGDFDSMAFVRAADAEIDKVNARVMAADTAGNTGLVHDSWLNEIITTSLGTTAAIDAIGVSPLMETGLSFKIPAVTQYPTAATTAEGSPASDTDMEVGDIDVAIVKKAGKQVITFELFDRSTPSFYQEVLRQIRVALGKNKDEYALAQLIAGGTAAATTAGTIAGLQSYIATETSAALSGSGDFADMLLTSPDWWTTIKAAKDSTGRGLYNAINPMNANGRVTPQSLRGEVEGMNLYVDPFLAAGSGLVDNSALILTGQAARYWESPIRQIQINNLTDGAVEVEYYQYVACQVVKAAGVRKFNLT